MSSFLNVDRTSFIGTYAVPKTFNHLLLTSRITEGKQNKNRNYNWIQPHPYMKSAEDKICQISEDLSRGGLNTSTNSITSFTYYLPDWLYLFQTCTKVLIEMNRGLNNVWLENKSPWWWSAFALVGGLSPPDFC